MQLPAAPAGSTPHCYPLAPLIRFTLLALYLALVLPLPVMAPPGLRPFCLVAVPLGFLLVSALLSEQVQLDGEGVRVTYPAWCRWWLRRGWSLRWEQIHGLMPIGTSQGGTVHYLKGPGSSRYLLPQRVARFPEFLERVQQATGLKLAGVGRITPPWTYWTLAGLSVAMLLGEAAAFALSIRV
ncbi:hypothetical protein KBY86_01705 [Synechococcus sp. Lug-A]|uniref:hypothetical protein n=1 Tax=Synechococcus sp. Lug-A TaxID=2823740 RepID=UPI0020CCC925|nr:hypothetical protein [Synechococcus sp. Lug-A]MCP9845617.1 hypothetical protein [Synechococcus sp. Lug-A]